MKALVDIDSLTGIFSDCCLKPENLINIGYLESNLKTWWQCVSCSRLFTKKQENQQPFQSRNFNILKWQSEQHKGSQKQESVK